MTKDKIINVIDLGSSKITTLVASVSPDHNHTASLIGIASIPVTGFKRGQIVDIESVAESLTKSVESAERMAGVNIGSAFISIGSGNMTCHNSHGVVAVSDPTNEIKDDDVNRVIEAAKAITIPSSFEVIHVMPREYIVDGQSGIRDPRGMMGIRLEVETHIIVDSLPNIRNIAKIMKELGIEIEKFVFSGLASSLAVLTATEKDLGVAILDIGSGKTDMAVWVDGALTHSAVLPVGGLHVTKDIALGLQVSLESAEKIKLFLSDRYNFMDEETKRKESYRDEIDISELKLIEGTESVSKKTVIEGIIKPRLTEIFGLAATQLESNNLAGLTPAGIVLSGGGALTVSSIETGRHKIALSVRIGYPEEIGALAQETKSPAFATAIGLVKFAINEEKNEKKRESKFQLFKFGGTKNLLLKIKKLSKNFLP